MTTTMTRDELRTQVGQARIAEQEALKRRGLHSPEHEAAQAEYVRLSAAFSAASSGPLASSSSYRERGGRQTARGSGYRRGEGCPMHGETCAPEYR